VTVAYYAALVMEDRDRKTDEWQAELQVRRQAAGGLLIEVVDGGGKRLVFSSWASLYDYLSRRFPEHHSYLR